MANDFVPMAARAWKTTKEVLRELPSLYGDRDMFREKDGQGGVKTLSAAEFQAMTANLGAAFDTLGLLEKKVAILGETSVKWIMTFLAETGGGGVAVPLDRDLPADELAEFMRDSGASALVYSPAYADVVEEMRKRLPETPYFISMGAAPGADLSLDALIESGASGAAEYMKLEPGARELAAILYTSGTTGKSKGVMLAHENMLSSASNALMLLKIGKTSLSVLPIHHAYELSHGMLMMMINGSTICVNDSLRYLLPNLRLFKPDVLLVVPLFVEMLYKSIWKQAEAEGKADELRALIKKSNELLAQGVDKRRELFAPVLDKLGGELRLVISGGAPLRVNYQKGLEEFGIEVLEGWGITECGPVLCVNPCGYNRHGTVGLPFPCSEVIVADPDENGEGELLAKGPNVMLGYYNNPEATDAVFEDGWFRTGDLGSVDEDGYVSITGRVKNLIVLTNGKNVHPEEIEEYLEALPAVQEVVVYSPMEADGSQVSLAAEIYPEEGFAAGKDEETLRREMEELLGTVNRRLPGYKQIVDFTLRSVPFEKTTKKSIKRFMVKHKKNG